MPRKKGTSAPPRKRPIERYEHTDKKRINNASVGLITQHTDPGAPTFKVYDCVNAGAFGKAQAGASVRR